METFMLVPKSAPTKNFKSVASELRRLWKEIEPDWLPVMEHITPYFETVALNQFLARPTAVFTDAYRGSDISEEEYPAVANALAGILTPQIAETVQQQQQEKPNPTRPAPQADAPRNSPILVEDLAAYIEAFGSYKMDEIASRTGIMVRRQMTYRELAELIVTESKMDQFLDICAQVHSTQHNLAKRHLPIKWADGTPSYWNLVRFTKFLETLEVDDIDRLIVGIGYRTGDIGRDTKVPNYVYNLVSYLRNRGGFTKLLEEAAKTIANPVTWML